MPLSASSSSRKARLNTAALWLLRVAVGAVFIISGWAKTVDLWGFCLKIEEYLTVWGINGMPYEIVLIGAGAISILEFTTGVLLAVGALRRLAPWTAAAMMALWLPLTAWIALTNPVENCGCFGDFIVLSNTATFLKNLALTAGVVLLCIYNRRRKGIYPPEIQWLVICAAWAYGLTAGYVGYQVQPLVDFRPFRTGTPLYADTPEGGGETSFIYSKDGHTEEFSLDALPDSTWTYVGTADDRFSGDESALTVFDTDGNDITDDLAEAAAATPATLIVVIPNPTVQFMTRARYLNDLQRFASRRGMEMYALVGGGDAAFERWSKITRPAFPAYRAEDTSLKMVVRGLTGVVYLHGGDIAWKRTLGSLSPDLPYLEASDDTNPIDDIKPVDTGSEMLWLTLALAGVLALLYLLGLSPRLLRLLSAKR